MNKNNVFFGEKGLTSTSANFIANQAKEFVQTIQEELDGITFLDCDVCLIGRKTTPVVKGVKTLDDIKEKLETIGLAKSLIAWLREAIKARESLKEDLPDYDIWREKYGQTDVKVPDPCVEMSEDEVLAAWNIKDRNRYLYLEAKAAVYGKYIHPDGAFGRARKELKTHLTRPVDCSLDGINTLLRSYTPSISAEKVDAKFFELQSIWRKYQAELNAYKHLIKTTISDDIDKKMLECKNETEAFYAQEEKNRHEYKQFINSENKRISKLKILIPNELQSIYETINGLNE